MSQRGQLLGYLIAFPTRLHAMCGQGSKPIYYCPSRPTHSRSSVLSQSFNKVIKYLTSCQMSVLALIPVHQAAKSKMNLQVWFPLTANWCSVCAFYTCSSKALRVFCLVSQLHFQLSCNSEVWKALLLVICFFSLAQWFSDFSMLGLPSEFLIQEV